MFVLEKMGNCSKNGKTCNRRARNFDEYLKPTRKLHCDYFTQQTRNYLVDTTSLLAQQTY